MKIRPLFSGIARGYRLYRKGRDTFEREFAASCIYLIFSLGALALPFILYADVDGLWTHLLAQFNAHGTPLADKFAAYLEFLRTTQSFHWFVVTFYGALALDVLCLVLRFALWCLPSSSASPQS